MAKFLKMATSPDFTVELIFGAFGQYHEKPLGLHLVKKDKTEALYLVEFKCQSEAQRVLKKLNKCVIRGVLPPHYFIFGNVEETQPATTETTTQQQGKLYNINVPEEETYQIYVRFSYSVTQTQLQKAFLEKFNSITSVRIIMDRYGISKGYGFITFDSKMEYQAALEITDEQIQIAGTPIYIRNAFPKSYKPNRNRIVKRDDETVEPNIIIQRENNNSGVNCAAVIDKNLENYLVYESANNEEYSAKNIGYASMQTNFSKKINILEKQSITNTQISVNHKSITDETCQEFENEDQLTNDKTAKDVNNRTLCETSVRQRFEIPVVTGDVDVEAAIGNNLENLFTTQSTQTIRTRNVDDCLDGVSKLSVSDLSLARTLLNRYVTLHNPCVEISSDKDVTLIKILNNKQTIDFIEEIRHCKEGTINVKQTLSNASNQDEFKEGNVVIKDATSDSVLVKDIKNEIQVQNKATVGISNLIFIYLLDFMLLLAILLASKFCS